MKYLRPTIIALLASAVLLVSARDEVEATSFNPSSTYGVSDSTPSASADVFSTYSVLAPDALSRTLINFTPPEWVMARDADIPDGALVAELAAVQRMGLIGGGCSNLLFPHFDMMDATTSMSTLVPFQDPEEEFDPPDLNDSQGSEPDDQFDIGPDGLPLGVTRYPDYLTRIFKDAGGNTLIPISRSYGQTGVAGIEVSVNFVFFEPGTVFQTPAGETISTDPRLGYPSATVLNAMGDPDMEADIEDNNSVSDFCSAREVNTTTYAVSRDNPNTAADEGGRPVRTNPGAGTYKPVVYAVSQYDADNDGIENGLDPCPTVANPNWDPREHPGHPAYPNPNYTGDADLDGLPDECDPEPTIPGHHDPSGVFDEDFDRYGNRADNCPLVANSAGQLGGKAEPPAAPDDNQDDADLDGIGDACDPNSTVPDGHDHAVCLVSTVDIGGGGPPPDPAPQDMSPCSPALPSQTVDIDIKPGSDANPINLACHGVIPVAILTTDDFDASTVDPDTVTFAGAAPKKSRLEDVDGDGDTDTILHFRCQGVSIDPGAEEACLQGSTYDGLAFEACDSVRIVPPDSPQDSDGDGFTDADETCVGTDLLDDCPDDLTDDAWPADFDMNAVVNVLDLGEMLPPYFGSSAPNPDYSERRDLVPDGVINILDVGMTLPPTFGSVCT